MSRTKTRKAPRRPTPRRAAASRKEIRFPIPGHALGEKAHLLMRRRSGRWSITDTFRGGPAFVGAGQVWRELKPDTAEADLYCWSESQARALVARFVEQAVEIARNNRALDAAVQTARRVESLAADMAPPEVMPQVLTLEQVAARLQEATAEVAARMKRRAPVEERTYSLPAAVDRPGWQPPKPDPAPDRRLLSLKAMGISANANEETAALDVRRVHGPAETAVLPVLAQYPPMPEEPPTVHLTHLSETHPTTGARIARSVADALASH